MWNEGMPPDGMSDCFRWTPVFPRRKFLSVSLPPSRSPGPLRNMWKSFVLAIPMGPRSCTKTVRIGMHAACHRSDPAMLHKLLDVITICGLFSSLVLDWVSGFLSLFPIHNMDFDETALTPQLQGERGFVCSIDKDQPSRSAGDGVMAWRACLRSR